MKNRDAPEACDDQPVQKGRLVKSESHVDGLKQLREAIACRVYGMFESHGFSHGQDFGDWLRAVPDVPSRVLSLSAEMPSGYSCYFTAPEPNWLS